MTATLRAHHALHAAGLAAAAPRAGLPPAGHPERVTNALNEVWRCGPYILRINPRPGATRLQREATLLRRLPAEVKAPAVVSAGAASWGEWQISHRLPGRELSRDWTSMGAPQRRRSIKALGAALRALHQVEADAGEPPGGASDCPHPLPAERLLRVLAEAASLPGVDRAVCVAAAERVAELSDVIDIDSRHLVHGDLHLENVLTTGDGVSGLLDFEWAQAGPADLDLDVLLHSLADPSLHVESGEARPLQRRDFDEVVGWLHTAYPELFAHPRLADRLWVYRLAYDVRALVSDPSRDTTAAHHPYQRLIRLVEGRSDLGWYVGR